jgi:hypothetical protein
MLAATAAMERRAPKLSSMRGRTIALAGAVAAVLLAFAAGARADGDPASDVLPGQDVFLPFPAPTPSVATPLKSAVASVYAKHRRIKVAIIATAGDLGAVPSLFGKPKAYAKFLGSEIGTFYVGPLLVVMPSGFGIADFNRPTPAADRILSPLDVGGSSPDDLTRAATDAIKKLAAAKALASKDVRAPIVYPQPATAHRGKTARIAYTVLEDSEYARDTITLKRGRRVVATVHTKLRFVLYSKPTSATWRVPRSLPPVKLRYCVVSTDGSGNRGIASCETLRVR